MSAEPRRIERSVEIDARPEKVWDALTRPDQMTAWMGEAEMELEIATDWSVGGPIRIRGFLHGRFENSGTVLQFDEPRVLRYTQLSSISRLPDTRENHSVFEFRLAPAGDRTSLTIAIEGFPTESIYKHLDFYWRGTLGILKRFVEAG